MSINPISPYPSKRGASPLQEPLAKKQKQACSQRSLTDDFKTLEEILIANFFKQVAAHNESAWHKIHALSGSLSGRIGNDLSACLSALKGTQEGQTGRERYALFVEHLDAVLDACHTTQDVPHLNTLGKKLEKICASMLCAINAETVHRLAVDFFSDTMKRPASIQVDAVLDEIPAARQTERIRRLAETWLIVGSRAEQLEKHKITKLPNLVFTLAFPDRQKEIRVIRMRSPDRIPEEETVNPRYRSMLNRYRFKGMRHIDLSLLRLSGKEREAKGARIRYQTQDDYPDTLLAWAADPYSAFMRQTGSYAREEGCSAKRFKKELFDQITDNEKLAFILPKKVLKDPSFPDMLAACLTEVHEDFFSEGNALKKTLTPVERQDFAVLAVIVLLERFCQEYQPDSLDTTCHSHIDRGMVLTTLLYLYAASKTGQINEQAILDRLEPMIFAPSLLYAQRPTHSGRIKRLLSVMSRLCDPVVARKLQARKTHFSAASIIQNVIQ